LIYLSRLLRFLRSTRKSIPAALHSTDERTSLSYSYDFDAVNTSYWLASVVIPEEVSEGILRATIAENSIV
jgi:hypothetical protein